MNTAVRALGSHLWSVRKLEAFSYSARGVGVALLVGLLFFSAFAIVYVKDLNRRLFIREQILQQESALANERWGKLLLEQSTLTNQARIHALAMAKLDMILPTANQIKSVKEEAS